MKLKDIVEKLELQVVVAEDNGLEREIKGAYCSDMLSDVMANAKENNLWITIQIHQNVIAVSALLNLGAVIISGSVSPEENAIQKAAQEGLVLLRSDKTTYQLAGQLYQLGI